MGKFLVANEDSNLRALEFKVRPFTTGLYGSLFLLTKQEYCELIKSKYKGTVPRERGGEERRLCSGNVWQAYGTLLEYSMLIVRNVLTEERG